MSVSGSLRFQRPVASVAAEPEARLLSPAPPLHPGQCLPSLGLRLPFLARGWRRLLRGPGAGQAPRTCVCEVLANMLLLVVVIECPLARPGVSLLAHQGMWVILLLFVSVLFVDFLGPLDCLPLEGCAHVCSCVCVCLPSHTCFRSKHNGTQQPGLPFLENFLCTKPLLVP